MKKLSSLEWSALILVLVGGLNWGLVGLLGLDLVALLFGEMSLISRVVYSLVGISTVMVAMIAPGLAKKE